MTRPRFDLALVSGLVLFLELACIRWFPAHVLFLSFFTNAVLLAAFVGMSVGCLLAKSETRQIRRTPYWLAGAVALGLLCEAYHGKLERHLDVGNQANPDVVFFGAETSALNPVEFVVPIEVVAGLFYFLVAAVMVGPGQELGRAFNRVPNRSTAYALNLLGSLAGILLFAACSELSLPPVVWFALVAGAVAYFLSPLAASRASLAALTAVILLSAVTSGVADRKAVTVWSPYYRIRVNPDDKIINTNLISHQVMTSRETPSGAGYSLPYLFLKETNRPMPKRVLIIGAGSGNDVSRSLAWCPPDAKIDAVEIDPAIRKLGGQYHPDKPYDDPRVTTHLTDGRTFLRTAPEGEYDLVVFALVDSLVLHAGAGNVRLESYLFTEEAFADAARVTKPTGTMAVYNFFRHGWIVARLRDAARKAFGADPVVLTDPPADAVNLNTFDSAFTAVFAGRPQAIQPLHDKFAANGNGFWVPTKEAVGPETACRFAPDGPAGWVKLRSASVEESGSLPPATDDWPFLYVRKPTVPGSTWRGIGLVLVLSFAVWWTFRDRMMPVQKSTPQDRGMLVRSFLLGSGFMLLETKAVVEMALLFGSTWVVNTVVFAAVLVMSLAGNRVAAWAKPKTLWPYYLGLFASLALGFAVPVEAFLGWPAGLSTAAACTLAFLPVAFAGVIFAVSFERSGAADRMFGANVAGALAGGLLENLSLVLGFRWLLLVAGGLYLLSGLFGGRQTPLPGQTVAYNEDAVMGGRVTHSRLFRWVRKPRVLPTR